MQQPKNYSQLATQQQELEQLPPAVVQQLVSMIAAQQPAIYNGRRYTGTEVSTLLSNMQSGVKPPRISIYNGDYLMTQGAKISPEFEEQETKICYYAEPAENGIVLPFDELPTRSCAIDLKDTIIGGKRYYMEQSLKEDIKLFATFFSYETINAFNKKTVWKVNAAEQSYWAMKGIRLNPVPYAILEDIVPTHVVSGQALIEYLYTHKETWPLVQTVVWSMIRDITVPSVDENGEQEYAEDGVAFDMTINDTVHFTQGGNIYSRAVRNYRTDPIMYKPNIDKYKGFMQLRKLMDETKISIYKECHNDYYDGIDYSKNLSEIRMKIACMDMISFESFPENMGVVTGQSEEFAVVMRYFKENYPDKTLIHLSEKAALNYDGFKIFLSPISKVETIPIHDKSQVNRAMITDTGIIRAIRHGEYPRGFGFMTNLLLAHHPEGQEATEKHVPGEESDYLEIGHYHFKQLHSEAPLSFYPYIYWTPDLVAKLESRTCYEDPLVNLNDHIWLLLNYPYSKYSVCEHKEQSGTPVHWTPGKTARDVMFELDEGFKRGVNAQFSFAQSASNVPRRLKPTQMDKRVGYGEENKPGPKQVPPPELKPVYPDNSNQVKEEKEEEKEKKAPEKEKERAPPPPKEKPRNGRYQANAARIPKQRYKQPAVEIMDENYYDQGDDEDDQQ